MPIPEKMLEIREHTKEGYNPVIDYCTWRVAVLNYSDGLRPENLNEMQCHNETDEVFVLLKGKCILFIGGGDQDVTQIFAEDMQPCKVYNVKKSIWHTHALSRDAMVLVVENRDTTVDNSRYCRLNTTQRQVIVNLTRELWQGNFKYCS